MPTHPWRALYPTLRGTERYRLAARAVTRGDQQEITRLIQTCPTQPASRLDAEFLAVKHAVEATSQALAPAAAHLGFVEEQHRCAMLCRGDRCVHAGAAGADHKHICGQMGHSGFVTPWMKR